MQRSSNSTHFLYLSSFASAPYQTSRADLANVKFNINWDSFFNGENYQYRSCRIRYVFLSDPATYTGNAYTYDPANHSGVIVANGLAPKCNNPNLGGCIIGIIKVEPITYVSNAVSINTAVLNSDDLTSACGQNIYIPTGMKELNIQLWDNAYASSAPGKLLSTVANATLANWNLQLMFELYDPIEEN